MIRKLKRAILQRKTAEEKLKKSKQHYNVLLGLSHKRQEHARHLARQNLLGQEKERKEISHELHDEFAQTLTGINLHLGMLKAEISASTKSLRKKIVRTQQHVKSSLSVMLKFARDLRPTILDDLGLIPALHSYTKDFTKRTGIRIQLKSSHDVERLNFIKRTVFYRVAQAVLANIAQHAQANLVKVNIQKRNHFVNMEIKDNGKSFKFKNVLFSKKIKQLGLLNMRECVEMVGGIFTVESIKGMGTTIGVQVPFK